MAFYHLLFFTGSASVTFMGLLETVIWSSSLSGRTAILSIECGKEHPVLYLTLISEFGNIILKSRPVGTLMAN